MYAHAQTHTENTLSQFFFIPSPSLFLSSLLLHTLQSVMKEKAGSFGMGRMSEQNKQTSRSSTAGRRHRPRIFNKGDSHTHTLISTGKKRAEK